MLEQSQTYRMHGHMFVKMNVKEQYRTVFAIMNNK